MDNFKEFLAQNKDKINKIAKSSNTYDGQGRPTISPNDVWRKETVWDELYKELKRV